MKLSFFAASIAVAAAFNFAEGKGEGIRGGVNSATLVGCYFDSDCASGRCEDVGFAGGTCKAKEGGGAACNEDSDCLSDECTGSFGCSINNSCTCEPPACSSSEDCLKLGGAYRCEGSTIFADGICEAKEDVGAACNEDEDCLSNVCRGSFGCSANNSCTCRPSDESTASYGREDQKEYNADVGEGDEDHTSSSDGHTAVA